MPELTNHSFQLYSDMQTLCSEVKKCVTCSIADDYHLSLPENLQSVAEHIAFIKNKATQLVENSQFLYGAPDSLVSNHLQFPALPTNWTISGENQQFCASCPQEGLSCLLL